MWCALLSRFVRVRPHALTIPTIHSMQNPGQHFIVLELPSRTRNAALQGLGYIALLGESAAFLITKQNKVSPAAYSKFTEQVRDVEFHRSLGNIQLAPNFLVR